MSKLIDVFFINLLWIVFSIPIITIGASTEAAFYVTIKIVDDEEGYIFKDFFKAFKQNFLQGTILWLITVVFGYALYLLWQIVIKKDDISFVIILISIFSTVFVIAGLLYSYPLVARYENKLINHIKNSYNICIKYFGKTIILFIVILIELFCIFWNKWSLLVGVLIGPEIVIYSISGISKRIFQRIDKDAKSGE
ncbi:MAG: YesL family protein [Treponema sp.]|nr:YesL family protein [Treponema sp.]